MKKDMTEEEKKRYKFLLMILKILIGVLILVLVAAVVTGIRESEKKEKEEAKIQQQDDKLEKTTQQTKSKTETQITGTTESEKAYLQLATPYISEILKNNQDIMNSQQKGDNWNDTINQLAQKIVESGDSLENLQYADDTKTIGTLVQLFGYNISHGYENYIEAFTNSDTEKLEFYQMDYKTAMCQLNEINFYSTHGVEISKQLEKDIKALLGEHIFNNITLSSGTDYVTIVSNIDYLEDEKALKNSSLMTAYDILKYLSKNQYYNYLTVNLGTQCQFEDGTQSLIMIVEFSSQKRLEVNFDDISWINIPEIADKYTDKL